MQEPDESPTRSRCRPFQHFPIAIRIAERKNRPPADKSLYGLRLAWSVMQDFDFRHFEQHGTRRSDSEFGNGRRPHHSLGRNAIGFFGKDANEIRTVSRNNENFELVGPQITEQLQHRLINKIRIDATEARILCRSEPLGNDARELLRAHARLRHFDDLDDPVRIECRQAIQATFEHRSEWFSFPQVRIHMSQRFQPVENKNKLDTVRLLWPKRAVVVEYSDALPRRH